MLGEVAVTAAPSSEAIQYLDIGVRIANSGAPFGNARVILHVQRDGAAVEDFPLASSLAISTGSTNVAQRYVPSGGWMQGAYAFALTLETVDPASGVSVVIAEVADRRRYHGPVKEESNRECVRRRGSAPFEWRNAIPR